MPIEPSETPALAHVRNLAEMMPVQSYRRHSVREVRQPWSTLISKDRAKRRGLTLQGYVADLIEADVNQARAAFMAGAATFLAQYSDAFEAEVGQDRYPGLPQGLAESAPRDAA